MNHLDVVRRLKYLFFRATDKNISDEDRAYYFNQYDALFDLFDKDFDLDAALKEYDKYRAKTRRVRRKILEMMFYGSCSFLTLTFTDEVLANTSQDTRRRYVARFLKQISDDYVGNVDYGKINGREHYHAVVRGINIDMSAWDKYGFSHAQIVGKSDGSTQAAKMSKYIYKLSNHATKGTTNNKKIIYSRQK